LSLRKDLWDRLARLQTTAGLCQRVLPSARQLTEAEAEGLLAELDALADGLAAVHHQLQVSAGIAARPRETAQAGQKPENHYRRPAG
jgi:hypothetical protein